jgi:hypothetical protein
LFTCNRMMEGQGAMRPRWVTEIILSLCQRMGIFHHDIWCRNACLCIPRQVVICLHCWQGGDYLVLYALRA